jgi:hypothetical protein
MMVSPDGTLLVFLTLIHVRLTNATQQGLSRSLEH